MHLAIQCAEQPVIEYVLSQPGTDVNARDRDGNTPLHVAASLGRAPVVKLMLEQPDTNDSITNFQGKIPLDLARNPEIFQQLQLARSVFIDRNVRKERTWHFVIFTKSEQLAREYTGTFASEMEDFTLGREKVRVQYWGCVLPS